MSAAKIAIRKRLSPFKNERPAGTAVDTIVLHSMHCPVGEDIFCPNTCIEWFSKCEVSSHYMIDRTGVIWQLVEDDSRAWHAGKSKMPDGRENVNDFSIGIELIASKDSGYEAAQMESLVELCKKLKQDYEIKFILGHKDVAIDRDLAAETTEHTSENDFISLAKSGSEPKTDPWGFDWESFLIKI